MIVKILIVPSNHHYGSLTDVLTRHIGRETVNHEASSQLISLGSIYAFATIVSLVT
jgi:hypothetical protein